MAQIVKYINHNGESFTLNGDGLTYMDIKPLRAFTWDYVLSNRLNGMGGSASSFARRPKTVQVEIRQRGYSREQFVRLMNRLHSVAEADCIEEKPGKLYVGDQYLVCFLAVNGSIERYPQNGNFAYRECEILAVEPYWCTDVTTAFNIASNDEIDLTGKKYNLRYPYRYGSGFAINKIVNTHYASCPAVIQIFGPCDNPRAVIGDAIIQVDVTITEGERLVIDQVNNRVYIVGSTGQETNVFNKRNKEYNIFERVPAGETTVLYDGTFKMSVTLVRQRSELLWT